MNELLKLGVAFATGAVVMYLFIGYVNEAHAPTTGEGIAPTSTATSSDDDTEDVSTATAPPQSSPTTANTPAPPQQEYQPPAEPQYPTSRSVRFTGSRFQPDETVIVTGGRVTWRNDSEDADMRIVTNFHPRHEGYPVESEDGCSPTTFDQCVSVGPGGTWTFTFTEDGKWYYHNEEKPDVTGMVRVLSREDYDKEF